MKNSEKRYIDIYDDWVVSVALGRNGEKGIATMFEADFDLLIDMGLSSNWNALPNGYVTAAAINAKGGNVGVARVLMDAGEGQIVNYLDGNKKNLRRNNLEIHYGGFSTRRDRDFLTPANMRRRPSIKPAKEANQ